MSGAGDHVPDERTVSLSSEIEEIRRFGLSDTDWALCRDAGLVTVADLVGLAPERRLTVADVNRELLSDREQLAAFVGTVATASSSQAVVEMDLFDGRTITFPSHNDRRVRHRVGGHYIVAGPTCRTPAGGHVLDPRVDHLLYELNDIELLPKYPDLEPALSVVVAHVAHWVAWFIRFPAPPGAPWAPDDPEPSTAPSKPGPVLTERAFREYVCAVHWPVNRDYITDIDLCREITDLVRRCHDSRPVLPPHRLLRSARDAEVYAAEVVEALGYSQVRVCRPGADGGVDVRADRAVVQVKMEAVKTARSVLQALFGVAAHERCDALFFSLAGYTAAARTWAEQTGMALFVFDYSGGVTATSSRARELLLAGAALSGREP